METSSYYTHSPMSILPYENHMLIFPILNVQDQKISQLVCKVWCGYIEKYYVTPENKKECWASQLLPNLAMLPKPIENALGGMYKIYMLPTFDINFDVNAEMNDILKYNVGTASDYPALMRAKLNDLPCIVMKVFCMSPPWYQSYPLIIGHNKINPILFSPIFSNESLNRLFNREMGVFDEESAGYWNYKKQIILEECYYERIQDIINGKILFNEIMLDSNELRTKYFCDKFQVDNTCEYSSVLHKMVLGLIPLQEHDLLDYLIKNSDLNNLDANGNSILHNLIARAGNEGVDLNKLFQFFMTMLMNNANTNVVNRDNMTPLHYVIQLENDFFSADPSRAVYVANLLVEWGGADINKSDSNGNTALHFAIAKENNVCIEFLISNGADLNKKNKAGITPQEMLEFRNNNNMGLDTSNKRPDI